MTEATNCACEHVSHFDDGEGETERHEYGTVPAAAEIKTDFGTFRVCAQCAEDHLALYAKYVGSPEGRKAIAQAKATIQAGADLVAALKPPACSHRNNMEALRCHLCAPSAAIVRGRRS